MGAEIACDALINRATHHGKAKLETSTLEFRAPGIKFVAPFADITKLSARDGTLVVGAPAGTIALAIGSRAGKWADRIRNPPTRLKKLGAKPSWRVRLVGPAPVDFVAELEPSVARLATTAATKANDAVFFFLEGVSDLARVAALKRRIAPDGAVWLLRRKGDAAVKESAVMAAGRAAGLVDVKVVGFSAEWSARKFVIPAARRLALATSRGSR